jgi:peptidyl-prolyl cis-trans isomerase A (cyclophilin A)
MNIKIKQRKILRTLNKLLMGIGVLSFSLLAHATTVQIQTVMGNFEVNLFDKQTPKTVENFLSYVNSGAYTNSIVHRTVPDFIVQGGGYGYTGTLPPTAIPQSPSVLNEPIYSSVRGTIAMAKLGSSPNSATNQWFINLKDNSANLDFQNGGFTVFGQVTGEGMAIVDAIAALNRYNLGGVFTETPLRNFTSGLVDDDHLVMVTGVVVLDASPDTADGLNPVRSVSSSSSSSANSGVNNGGGGKSGGGGGSMGLFSILLLGLLLMPFGRQRKK